MHATVQIVAVVGVLHRTVRLLTRPELRAPEPIAVQVLVEELQVVVRAVVLVANVADGTRNVPVARQEQDEHDPHGTGWALALAR